MIATILSALGKHQRSTQPLMRHPENKRRGPSLPIRELTSAMLLLFLQKISIYWTLWVQPSSTAEKWRVLVIGSLTSIIDDQKKPKFSKKYVLVGLLQDSTAFEKEVHHPLTSWPSSPSSCTWGSRNRQRFVGYAPARRWSSESYNKLKKSDSLQISTKKNALRCAEIWDAHTQGQSIMGRKQTLHQCSISINPDPWKCSNRCFIAWITCSSTTSTTGAARWACSWIYRCRNWSPISHSLALRCSSRYWLRCRYCRPDRCCHLRRTCRISTHPYEGSQFPSRMQLQSIWKRQYKNPFASQRSRSSLFQQLRCQGENRSWSWQNDSPQQNWAGAILQHSIQRMDSIPWITASSILVASLDVIYGCHSIQSSRKVNASETVSRRHWCC